MNNVPAFSETELEQYLQRLGRQINRKMRARLPKLELTQDQIAKLEKLACSYATEIEEVFTERDFRPHPSIVRYISLKAMNEAVSLMHKYPTSNKTERGRRDAVVARIQEGVDEVLKAFDATFYDLTGEELLLCVLTKPAEQAARLIDLSTLEQAEEIMRILIAMRSGGRSAFYQIPKGDPRDNLDWLSRCVFERYVQDPKVKEGVEALTRQGTKVLIPLSHAFRKVRSRGGKPPNDADPINDRILARLERELNIHGKLLDALKAKGRIGSPERIAESLVSSAKMIRRYRKEYSLSGLIPDGEGGLHYELTPGDVFGSIEIARGEKPGPKTNCSE